MADTAVSHLAQPLAEFSVNLLKEATKSANGGNVFMSPMSVQVALAMTYAGADTETKAQMNNVLFKGLSDTQVHDAMQALVSLLSPTKTDGHQLATANRIYTMHGFELQQAFNEIVSEKYASEVQLVNFAENTATAKLINDWVEQQTNSKIKNLVPANALNDLTRLVLVNAIYFKGDWKHKFEECATFKQTFYCSPKKEVEVDMMHQKEKFLYGEQADAQVLGLPYKNEDLTMFVILPKEPYGLDALLQSMTGEKLTKYMQETRSQKVEVSMPKFKVESQFTLNDALKQLGCDQMFDGANADFTQMMKGLEKKGDLYVSAVIHKAFLEVNETGSEAAAATAVLMFGCAKPMIDPVPDPAVIVDHNYLLVIANRYMPLFQGIVQQPSI